MAHRHSATSDVAADDAARGQVSGSAAQVYEDFFVPALFGQWPARVLDASGLATGDDVLDVGCGTGIVAREASRRLRGSGTVHGVDVNDEMLAVARRASADVGWHHAPAEQLPFDDGSFDRVCCQFALMFFSDPKAAVSEMARVTRPGGSVTVATWAKIDESPGYVRMVELLDRLFGPECASALLAPFTVGTADDLRSRLGPTLIDVEVGRHDGVARFESVDAWVHTDVRGWTLAGMIDDAQYDRLLTAARVEMADFVGDDGRVAFAAPALIGSGRVPGSALR